MISAVTRGRAASWKYAVCALGATGDDVAHFVPPAGFAECADLLQVVAMYDNRHLVHGRVTLESQHGVLQYGVRAQL